MDWVAQRRAPLVFQTCPPLDNPGARVQQRLRTWRMQLRNLISAMLLTYWVVKVLILSMVRIWVAESFPMRHRLSWDDDAQCADSFGRPASLAVMFFCLAIFAASYEQEVMSTVLTDLCINLAYTIDLGALSTFEVDGHSRLLHAWLSGTDCPCP